MDDIWLDVTLVSIGLLAGLVFPAVTRRFLVLLQYFQSPARLANTCLLGLNKQIFSCFLDPAYVDNTYVCERRVHIQKMRFINASLRLGKDAEKLNHLYAAILNYSQLRWRVTDFTVFSVCRKEFESLSRAINAVLKGKKEATRRLEIAIANLEDIFQQVLQVTSPEPLVFLLFIGGVKMFAREGINYHAR